MRRIAAALALILIARCAVAQSNDEPPPHFAVVFYPGLTFGDTRWTFLQGDELVPVNPLPGIGAGLTYGPLFSFGGTHMFISAEIGYGGVGTGQHFNASDPVSPLTESAKHTVEMNIRRLPIMTWMTLSTSGTISPYIRAGAGISKTDFSEQYSYPGPSISLSDWGFVWGIGGGLDARLTENISLALFLDDWITVEDLLEVPPDKNYPSGLHAPVKLTLVGFRVTCGL